MLSNITSSAQTMRTFVFTNVGRLYSRGRVPEYEDGGTLCKLLGATLVCLKITNALIRDALNTND